MDGNATQTGTDTQVQVPSAAPAEQQSAETKVTLEEFLTDETNKAAYETAVLNDPPKMVHRSTQYIFQHISIK